MKMDAAWLKRRLSVMSFAEIVYRIGQLVQMGAEKFHYKFARQHDKHVPEVSASGSIALFSAVSVLDHNARIENCSFSQARAQVLEHRLAFFNADEKNFVGNPVDWLRDPKSGVQSPDRFGKSIDYRDDAIVGDIKYLWELGRQQFLVPLAIDGLVYAHQPSLLALKNYIDSWLEQNDIGKGIHWCSALEVALRLISWSVVHSILKLMPATPGGLLDLVQNRSVFKQSLVAQIQFVMKNRSRFSSANNHLLGELTGVWVACQVFDIGSKGELYKKDVKQELELQCALQNHPDGVNREQAIYYHLWAVEYLWLAWTIGKIAGMIFLMIWNIGSRVWWLT